MINSPNFCPLLIGATTIGSSLVSTQQSLSLPFSMHIPTLLSAIKSTTGLVPFCIVTSPCLEPAGANSL